MINNELCQGCLTNNQCDQTPIKDCPCIRCIVKSMCRDACEEYEIFIDPN
jgi:hypothetical protein